MTFVMFSIADVMVVSCMGHPWLVYVIIIANIISFFFIVCNIVDGVFMCKAYNKHVFTQAILPTYGDFLCMIFW